MLVITCNNRLPDLDRDDAQGADHVAIFRPLVKWAKLVSHPVTIVQALQEAYLRATTGCPGPVLIDFARDALEATLEPELYERLVSDAGLAAATATSEGPERHPADTTRVRAAADILTGARSPVLWLGNGAKLSRAGEAALHLARRLDMPVITTFNGIGVVPTTDELVFGPLSRMGTSLSTRVLAGADVLLAIGNSFNAISTSRWSLELPETIVQVDVDPTVIGRYYGPRTLGILGDAGTVTRALEDEVQRRENAEAAAERRARLSELAEARREWWRQAGQSSESEPGTVAPDAVIRTVRAAVPEQTLAIFDAGNPGVWSYLWEIPQADTYLKPVGFGNMGFAVPAAIGAGVVSPGTPVVAFVGDGSLGMTLGELETLAREQTPACIVVMNDGGYGNIRQEQLIHYGDRTIGVDFGEVDYAAVARACGVDATRVTTEEALDEAVTHAIGRSGPYLVEVLIDPGVNAWTFPLFRQFEVEE
jgi:acetolactate synthase-1/2/3 large subunit